MKWIDTNHLGNNELKDASLWMQVFRQVLLYLLLVGQLLVPFLYVDYSTGTPFSTYYGVLAIAFLVNMMDQLVTRQIFLNKSNKYISILFDASFVFLWCVMHQGKSSLLFLFVFLVLMVAILWGWFVGGYAVLLSMSYILILSFWYPSQNEVGSNILTGAVISGVLLVGSSVHLKMKRLLGVLLLKDQSITQLLKLQEAILSQMPTGLIYVTSQLEIGFLNQFAKNFFKDRNLTETRQLQIAIPELYEQLSSIEKIDDQSDEKALQLLLHRDWKYKFNGETKHILLEVSRIRTYQDQQGYLLLFQDFTEKMELEKSLQQKEKMAAIGGLAAGIAHEIRNPLTSISGSIELLGLELSGKLEKDQDKLIQIALKETKRLNELITDFLDYVRPDQRAFEEVDLSKIIVDIEEAIRNGSEFRDVHKIKLKLEGACILGLHNRISQVLWNLMVNSLQAMPNGGVLTVGCSTQENGTVKLWISDEGMGISEDNLKHLFEPFFTTKARGTGLGLAMVYKIIELHRGEIKVDSQVGKGTQVNIVFPGRVVFP